MIDASEVVLFTTACSRPAYLEQSLASWGRVRQVGRLAHFVVGLGDSPVKDEQIDVINHGAHVMGLDSRMSVLPDSGAASRSPGMHRAIGEAIIWIRETLRPRAVIFTEEDIEVSSDVLEYLLWALSRWEHDRKVLTVCGHDEGGQGWDIPGIGAGGHAKNQAAVRLADYYNPWVWATWETRLDFLLDHWDWDCTKGPHPTRMGYDWGIRYLIHDRGLTSVVPDASRSQNIGRDGGWAAKPELFEGTLAASYRSHREPLTYYVVGEGEAPSHGSAGSAAAR